MQHRPAAEVTALSESFFEPLVAGDQKVSLANFLCSSIQALRGLPCLGSFSVVRGIRHIEGAPRLGSYSVYQALKRAPWVGSYSVVQCSSVHQAFDGQPPYCSAANAGVWGERSYGDGSTPYA